MMRNELSSEMKHNRRPHTSSNSNVKRLWERSAAFAVLTIVALGSSTPLAESFVHLQTQRLITPSLFITRRPVPPFTALGYGHDKNIDGDLNVNLRHEKDGNKSSKEIQESSSSQLSSSLAASASENSQEQNNAPSSLVNIRYRGTWYDVTKWRRAHSAGEHWLDWFDKRDATEIIDGLHSTHSRMMATRLPKAKPEIAAELDKKAVPDSKVQIAFRKLFDKLLAEGWWERDMGFEFRQLSIWAGLLGGALATVKSLPYVSFVLLALSFTGAGWLGHDYVHGLDPFAKKMRNFLPMTTGLCGRWWSDKHNKHHALTNEIGVDEDMATDPILYTWAPDPSQDSFLRKYQHYFFWFPFTLLFVTWRIDSIVAAVHAVKLKRPNSKSELYAMMLHYFLLFSLFPVSIWLPSFLLSGLISAFVVTSTHQSEEKFTDYHPDYVTRQFLCTRSVVMSNPISAWIWGGMQYQIEHHLFPSIPRSKLPALKQVIQQFANENNVEGGYRESGEFEILRMNWETYRAAALADPVEGAPLTRGRKGQQAAIAEGFTAVNPFPPNKKS